MSQTDPGSRGPSAPTDEPQHCRESETGQCQAIAVSTSQQCQHNALSGIRYCADHIDLADDLFTPGE